MIPGRAALVRSAFASIRRGSKSFRLASALFSPTVRERVWLLYAWCRRCDDLTDGQDHGGALAPSHDVVGALATIRAKTRAAFAGEATGDPAFDALGLVARETGLTPAMADDVIAGFALDAGDWRPRDVDDLLTYCYHVAGAVGVMMATVMGVAPDDTDTLDRACDLGIAFQLANIARDVGEDAAADRCYLPHDWMVEVGLTPHSIAGALTDPSGTAALATLGTRLAVMARGYRASARVGAVRLPFRSRWAVLTAARIYGGIADEVAARGASAWERRVVVSKPAKAREVTVAWVEAWRRRPSNPISRDGLWTRPRSTIGG